MNSVNFIKEAGQLIKDLGDHAVVRSFKSYEESMRNAQNLQKRVNALYSGLQNPTLPSAFRLRDAAYDAGLQVDGRVLQRLSQFEHM